MAKSPRTIYSSTQTKMIEYYSIDDICKTYTDTNWCSNEKTISDIEKSLETDSKMDELLKKLSE